MQQAPHCQLRSVRGPASFVDRTSPDLAQQHYDGLPGSCQAPMALTAASAASGQPRRSRGIHERQSIRPAQGVVGASSAITDPRTRILPYPVPIIATERTPLEAPHFFSPR